MYYYFLQSMIRMYFYCAKLLLSSVKNNYIPLKSVPCDGNVFVMHNCCYFFIIKDNLLLLKSDFCDRNNRAAIIFLV